jgi:hypothetical protein
MALNISDSICYHLPTFAGMQFSQSFAVMQSISSMNIGCAVGFRAFRY